MAQQFAEKIDRLLQPYLTRTFHFGSKQEAKVIISDLSRVQKELRLIKKEIGLEESAIRNQYTQELNNIRSGAVLNRFVGGFFGKLARANTANARAQLARQKEAALAPYERLRAFIDEKLVVLDRLKLDIQQKSLLMAVPAPPPRTTAPQLAEQTPRPASSLTIAERSYLSKALPWGEQVSDTLQAITSLSTGADFMSAAWVTNLRIALEKLHNVNLEIMGTEPPVRFAAVHHELFAAAVCREEMIDLDEKFLQTMDGQYIQQAATKMQESTAATNRATALMLEVNAQLEQRMQPPLR